MSDIASNDLALEHTPRGSPSPPHNQDILPETTESYAPAATEAYTEQGVNELEELIYESEAPATPVPPSLTSSPSATVTRTVAIIKPHALPHRFDIEHKISEAGFEVRPPHFVMPASGFPAATWADANLTRYDRDRTQIVKERQMEFDVETDPETLYELFGDDYECFAE